MQGSGGRRVTCAFRVEEREHVEAKKCLLRETSTVFTIPGEAHELPQSKWECCFSSTCWRVFDGALLCQFEECSAYCITKRRISRRSHECPQAWVCPETTHNLKVILGLQCTRNAEKDEKVQQFFERIRRRYAVSNVSVLTIGLHFPFFLFLGDTSHGSTFAPTGLHAH